jgi:hypothetical protein
MTEQAEDITERLHALAATKCVSCGQFVSYDSMQDGSALFYFEPDSHKGPEVSEWTCFRCVRSGR